MFFEKKFGIDLGSDTVKVYSLFRNKIFTAHNRIAYSGRQIIAVGSEAYEMEEKTPADVIVTSPMEAGTFSNLEFQEILLYRMMLYQDRFWSTGSLVLFAVPPDLSALERRAYYQIANGFWLKRCKVYLVEAPIAEALGMEIPFEESVGVILVNIGDQTSRLSILSNGRLIMSRMIPIGGWHINEAIIQEIRRRYHIQVGKKTAQWLKLAMGRLADQRKDSRQVVGIDSVSGLPREEVVSSYVVNAGIMNCINELGAQMKVFLERMPPQISYQVTREGIYLSGGSARIPYIDRYLASYTGVTFNPSRLYENTAVSGLEKLLHEKDKEHYLRLVDRKK
ncbi:MAG: rod shape-determining protein [Blautia sp.]|nr:rod shape-determining protein [Blautia sp.]